MPKRFERHARSRDEWDAPGSRHDELARALREDAGKSPGRKDPSRCKGNHGGPHVPVVSLRNETPYDRHQGRCRWGPMFSREAGALVVAWYCAHERRCGHCGLIFDRRVKADNCPAYPGDPEQRTDAERDTAERNARPPRVRSKPAVTGPQGYRRRREAG